MDKFRTMIVPAGVTEECRTMASTWPGGVGMFTVPVYTGDAVTHYMSTGFIDGRVAELMPWTDFTGDEPVRNSGDVPALVDWINTEQPALGVTEEQVTNLLAMCDVSTQPWADALARLGLSLVPEVAA